MFLIYLQDLSRLGLDSDEDDLHDEPKPVHGKADAIAGTIAIDEPKPAAPAAITQPRRPSTPDEIEIAKYNDDGKEFKGTLRPATPVRINGRIPSLLQRQLLHPVPLYCTAQVHRHSATNRTSYGSLLQRENAAEGSFSTCSRGPQPGAGCTWK